MEEESGKNNINVATPSLDVEIELSTTEGGDSEDHVLLVPSASNDHAINDKEIATDGSNSNGSIGHDSNSILDPQQEIEDAMYTEQSDLSSKSRTIWVVTTAALPWRTGTAVNPLLRALYLAKAGHTVTLYIPWLQDSKARQKLYGKQCNFASPTEQMDWIRSNFLAKDRAGQQHTFDIKFWKGVYHESFGSIFPIEDICSLIPSEQADVAILEEPEHLNWFRVVPRKKKKKTRKTSAAADKRTKQETHKVAARNDGATSESESSVSDGNSSSSGSSSSSSSDEEEEEGTSHFLVDCGGAAAALAATTEVIPKGKNNENGSDYNINLLGWAHKFNHVVGILHTNYGDYIRQYGMGTSLLTAPALNALSSLVVRAYCHKVIRLSATLPSLLPTTTSASTTSPSSAMKTTSTTSTSPKNRVPTGDQLKLEVTCNVHGVRSEFLDPPQIPHSLDDDSHGAHPLPVYFQDGQSSPAPVYFIGKLIWAKGFEQILELQELYRGATGDYFEVDVYGAGNDDSAIQRAFYGRHGIPPSRTSSTISSSSASNNSSRPTSPVPPSSDHSASEAAFFGKTTASLRSQLDDSICYDASSFSLYPILEAHTLLLLSENNYNGDGQNHDNFTTAIAETTEGTVSQQQKQQSSKVDPLDILGDFSQKTLSTGVETADAAMKMMESFMQVGMAFTKSARVVNTKETGTATPKTNAEDNANKKTVAKKTSRGEGLPTFHLAPARARFKWRRTPIPARFLGVQDHIIVRDIPQHKVFLNMSTSEVLCTTSAEALAMGKFVILPKHPSNEFFLQFPNCLGYDSLEDCLLKLQYALANNPEPLTEKYRRILSWDGATERLYEAAAITQKEDRMRKQYHVEEACHKAAKFHVNAARKGHFVRKLFRGMSKDGQ